MSLLFYKVLHIVGLILVFSSVGGMALHAAQGGTRATMTSRGLVFGTHGIGLLLVFVSGFGMLAKLGMTSGIPGWAVAKIGVWVVLGGVVALPLRWPALARPLWLAAPVLGGVAAWLALYKPF